MSKREIADHKLVSKLMNYDEISEIIKDLKKEKAQLYWFLDKQEIQKYEVIIDLYETHAEGLISSLTKRNHSNLDH